MSARLEKSTIFGLRISHISGISLLDFGLYCFRVSPNVCYFNYLHSSKIRPFSEEITYLMMCTDVNNDGKVDYMEFTERFHNPARDIGKHYCCRYPCLPHLNPT
jgi:hypothetical protein